MLLDKDTIHRRKLVKIPKPEVYVIYNGKDRFADRKTLRLSDAFMTAPFGSQQGGSLELEVPIINVNQGCNEDLIQRSQNLTAYVVFVSKVRELDSTGISLADSIIMEFHD
ncbi:MAG: hypothetical protein FWG14_13140 [Peptococcaceae bacterium]|nr:hypothetical protein [Peptococcaceae bacterium]